MNDEKHAALLYDSNCPLCSGYTAAFVGMGWLRPEGRVDYAAASAAQCEGVDMHRARHEIALLREGGVSYGVDALADLIADRCRLLRPLARISWLRAPFRPLYNFITYNRRLIAGTPDRPDQPGDCAPDFHFGWRMAFLLSGLGAWMLVALPVTLWVVALTLLWAVPAFRRGLRPGMDVAAQSAAAGWAAWAVSLLLPSVAGLALAAFILARRLPRFGLSQDFSFLSGFMLLSGGCLLI